MFTKVLPYGTVHIADQIVALIASLAIVEVDGVAGTVADFKDEMIRVVNKKSRQKGILIEKGEFEEISIEMKVALYYGSDIVETCKAIQAAVKYEIESMTGIEVNSVHVKVEQIKVKTHE
ncbi:putative alkaline shock family protein YloU [Bacillus mesophilus]|uniref:Asp23/Gls24 family envelope stress response protein n=1 Tax=Bacillus mesophilus TaxID=1808955 RepID=A0A6M0Q5H7_9BACI|nr:Asp23/Gls24 family envelope stress response protein [Bacillus mesophilus]MBM7659495.1 putative alkaline shock family protein YloU [Bacillus mesophilus]NEY70368.1 Asp23/Gls24 family envelope stress response protein [Bacillus mesophilus]